MIELLVLGTLAFAALAVIGILTAGLSLVFWVIFLPFRILGWVFKGLGLLLALPFIALFGVVGLLVFGFGALVFLLPFAPVALLVFLVGRASRKNPSPSTIST